MIEQNKELINMIDQLVNDDSDQAKQSFHDYLKPKLQSAVTIEVDSTNNED